MVKILVSHAHSDAAWAARAHARLAAAYGDDAVFSDVADIPSTVGAPGVAGRVSGLDAVVAIVGPGWLPQVREDRDMRAELAAARRGGIPLVPVLVEGTGFPRPDALPAELHGLAAGPVLGWDGGDAAALVAELTRQGVPGAAVPALQRAQAGRNPRLALVIAAALLVLGVAVAVLMAASTVESNGWGSTALLV